MTTTDEAQSSWELETGLVHDVDAWIANARFGLKEEYAAKVLESATKEDEGTKGLMFMFDLADEAGEIIGSQGYSVGSGWVESEDGSEMSHPKRNNVVMTCQYGRLQSRTVKDLHVNMQARGLPTVAAVWDGLGFHWMQEEHETVGGDTKTGLMPTLLLAEKDVKAVAKPAAKAAAKKTTAAVIDEANPLVAKLTKLAANLDQSAFTKTALQVAGITDDDALMAEVLDDGEGGFWATHQV